MRLRYAQTGDLTLVIVDEADFAPSLTQDQLNVLHATTNDHVQVLIFADHVDMPQLDPPP